ncbi:hypothetical protein ACOSQ2_014116 [Xanthoceras sorbifolium]
MSRKSQEEVTTEYWSKLFSQSSPSMKKDTNKEGPHNKEENEVEDLVEEWLQHQNTEIRSRWRIHCRCFPGISQATRNQTSLKGRIEQSLTWPEALTSNHTIPPTASSRHYKLVGEYNKILNQEEVPLTYYFSLGSLPTLYSSFPVEACPIKRLP